MTASDFSISNIQRATVNGLQRVLFTAHKRTGNAFVHVGRFSAPPRTARANLWRFVQEQPR